MAKSRGSGAGGATVRIKFTTEAAEQEVAKHAIPADGDCFYNSFLKVLELVRPDLRVNLTLEKLRYSAQHKLQEKPWPDFVIQISPEFERARDDNAEEAYNRSLHGYREPFKSVVDREFARYVDSGFAEDVKEQAHQTLLSYGEKGKNTYLEMVGKTNAWATALEVNALRELFNLNIVVFVEEGGIWKREEADRFGGHVDGGLYIPVLSDDRHFTVVDPDSFYAHVARDPATYVMPAGVLHEAPLMIGDADMVILEPEPAVVAGSGKGAGGAGSGKGAGGAGKKPSRKPKKPKANYDSGLTDEFYSFVSASKWEEAKALVLANKGKVDCSIVKEDKNVLDHALAFITDASSAQADIDSCFAMLDSFEEASIFYPLGRGTNTTILHRVIAGPVNDNTRRFFDVLLVVGDDDLLNCYNGEGQPPLLQAVEVRKVQYAEALAKHPRVDVNAPQVLVATCRGYNTKRTQYFWRDEEIWNKHISPRLLRVNRPMMPPFDEAWKREFLESIDRLVPGEINVRIQDVDEEEFAGEHYHGVSAFFAAERGGMPAVAKILKERDGTDVSGFIRIISTDVIMDFDRGREEVKDSITNNPYLDYLVHTNLATLRSAIRSHGKEFLVLSNVDQLNLLHFAVNMGQIPKVQFLLDIDEINALLPEREKISEAEFTSYINARTVYGSRAFEKVVVQRQNPPGGKIEDYAFERLDKYKHYSDPEKKQCILMFLECPQFDPNAELAFTVRKLPHLVLDFDDLAFAYQCGRAHPDFNWNVANTKGHSPLKEACIENKHRNVNQLVALQALGFAIDYTIHQDVHAVEEFLANYVDRGWLGREVRVVDLDVTKLVSVLRTQEPVKVKVGYPKSCERFELTFLKEPSEEDRCYIEDALQFAFDCENNKGKMKCAKPPFEGEFKFPVVGGSLPLDKFERTGETSAFGKLLYVVRNLDKVHWWMKRSQCMIKFEGIGSVWVHGKDHKVIYQYEDREITYNFVRSKLPDRLLDRRRRVQAGYLRPDYGDLMTEMARLGHVESFREFVNFSGIKFDNPLVEDHILADEVLPEIQALYREAKARAAEYKSDLEIVAARKAECEERIAVLEAEIRELRTRLEALEKIAVESLAEIKAEKDKSKRGEIATRRKEALAAIKPLKKPLNRKVKKLAEERVMLSEHIELPDCKEAKMLAVEMLDPVQGADLVQFATVLSDQLVRVNLVKGTKKYRGEPLVRRMDALSKLFVGTDVCCALTFVKDEGYILSFNYSSDNKLTGHHYEQIERVRMHLQKLAQDSYATEVRKASKRASCVVESVMQGLYRDKNVNTLDASPQRDSVVQMVAALNGNLAMLPDISKYKTDSYGAFETHDIQAVMLSAGLDRDEVFRTLHPTEEERAERNNLLKFNSLVTTTFRMFYSMRKVERSITTSSRRDRFPEDMITAFRDNKFAVVQEYETANIHAEMRVLGHLLANKKTPSVPYIGISKLCCAHCRMVITAMNASYEPPLEYTMGVRGSHGDSYTWEIPGFLAEQSALFAVFAGTDELKRLIERIGVEAALRVTRLIDNFYEDYKFDFSKLIKFINQNKRATEGDISTSGPGITTIAVSSLGAASMAAVPDSPVAPMPRVEDHSAASTIQAAWKAHRSGVGKTTFVDTEEAKGAEAASATEMGAGV